MLKDTRRFSYGLALLLANVTVVWARTPGPTPGAIEIVSPAQAPKEPQVSALVPADGGTVSLPGYGSVVFVAGTFPAGATVTVAATSRPDTAADFQETAVEMFSAGPRVPYEIRVTAAALPVLPADVTLVIPGAFLAQVPASARLHLLALIFQDGGMEVLDSFEVLPSALSQAKDAITTSLPPEAFTSRRRRDALFEAILVIATIPGPTK
jgi:hypothetical protein